MKKEKNVMRAGMAILLAVSIFALTGCGKKQDEGPKTELEDLMEDAQETFGETEDSYDADDYSGMEDSANDADAGEGDASSWRGDCYRFELEGKYADALNGKITSILFSDNSWVYASTADGDLFMLWPSIYFSKEESEMKSYQITDGSGIGELIYADEHIAYGKHHFVYFDRMEDYDYDEESMDDSYMLESMSDLPDITYTFENMQKENLSDDENLIYLTEDASFCVYEDASHHVRAGYRDSSDKEYMIFDDVVFEGDTELTDVTVDKSIFGFLLTTQQELFFIRKGNLFTDLADNVNGVSVSYTNLTDRIDGKVTGVYNLLNNTECCYAVDEEQNIYYVSAEYLDDINVEKITQFEDGTITDIQGFAGTNDEMLIRTEEGAYYFYDADSLYPVRKIDALDETCKNAVLLAEGDILALGNDGYLYVVEDKN